jgi:hypothetical protein
MGRAIRLPASAWDRYISSRKGQTVGKRRGEDRF